MKDNMAYPTVKELRVRHEKSQDNLEALRSEIGDENFIKFIMGILILSKGRGVLGEVTPDTVVNYCENAAFLLLLYVKWYLEDMKERVKRNEIEDKHNMVAWADILNDVD
jgi:hypothetical protein